MKISENVKKVKENVEAAKVSSHSSKEPVIIGVTKYVDVATARELFEAGIDHLAENRTELFLEKYEGLQDLDITWHLIGSLQRRKVRDVINKVDYFHALDSLKLAREISKRAEHKIKCFLQVNVSGEESKHGFAPSELEDELLSELSSLPNLEIVGLMTMAPIDADEATLRNIFTTAKALQEEIAAKALPNISCTELSMGMSRDYPIAIASGATHVRIGTDFFKD